MTIQWPRRFRSKRWSLRIGLAERILRMIEFQAPWGRSEVGLGTLRKQKRAPLRECPLLTFNQRVVPSRRLGRVVPGQSKLAFSFALMRSIHSFFGMWLSKSFGWITSRGKVLCCGTHLRCTVCMCWYNSLSELYQPLHSWQEVRASCGCVM